MEKHKRGSCYHTCEALYYLLGGKKAGWVPHVMRHEGDTHWFLRNNSYRHGLKPWVPLIIDPTVKQFKTKPDYRKARGCGFLTKRPSRRARELMKTLVWQE